MEPELQAAFEIGGSAYSVRARFVGDITEPGLDGARFELAVADPRATARLQVVVSGTLGGHAGMEIDPEVLEAAVEKRAGNFPLETRLRDLVARSPLALRREDLLALIP